MSSIRSVLLQHPAARTTTALPEERWSPEALSCTKILLYAFFNQTLELILSQKWSNLSAKIGTELTRYTWKCARKGNVFFSLSNRRMLLSILWKVTGGKVAAVKASSFKQSGFCGRSLRGKTEEHILDPHTRLRTREGGRKTSGDPVNKSAAFDGGEILPWAPLRKSRSRGKVRMRGRRRRCCPLHGSACAPPRQQWGAGIWSCRSHSAFLPLLALLSFSPALRVQPPTVCFSVPSWSMALKIGETSPWFNCSAVGGGEAREWPSPVSEFRMYPFQVPCSFPSPNFVVLTSSSTQFFLFLLKFFPPSPCSGRDAARWARTAAWRRTEASWYSAFDLGPKGSRTAAGWGARFLWCNPSRTHKHKHQPTTSPQSTPQVIFWKSFQRWSQKVEHGNNYFGSLHVIYKVSDKKCSFFRKKKQTKKSFLTCSCVSFLIEDKCKEN